MTTTQQLAADVFQRLEESYSAPTFWQYYEVYAAIMEAMNEAALITGVVQVAQSTPVTLTTNTNIVQMPAGALCLLRMNTATSAIQKTEMFTLDQTIPNWEAQGGIGANPPVTAISYWFPLGLSYFGIYPKLSVNQTVSVQYLAYPVAQATLNGTETVPFQVEFTESLAQYAAHVLRLKEAGQEFEFSQAIYQEFLAVMRRLSVFVARHDSLVFSRSGGTAVRVNPVEVR